MARSCVLVVTILEVLTCTGLVPAVRGQSTSVARSLAITHETVIDVRRDEDEWARGVASYYKPGQFSSLLPHIARPEGRIHFAGEHTSVWIGGWMQGALESGNQVAREVNDAA